MLPFISKLRRALRDFRAARSGNVAITFAIATLPMVGFVGAAIDYSHANAVKAAIQTALDSTALMLSKEAGTDTTAQLQTNAAKYFLANFSAPGIDARNITVSATYTTTGGPQVTVTGKVNVPTSFVSILDVPYIALSESSTAAWGSTRLRVALVLDNTGSMADANKLTTLKSATKNLLNQLSSAASQNGDVYVSIVPFAKDVNFGSANYKQSWIDWTAWDAANTTCSGWQIGNFCLGTQKPANHNTWNGCVMDRGDANGPDTGNYDANVAEAVTSNTATLYPAEQYSACPVGAMGLSYDWSTMSSLVDAMSPNGGTNQVVGLQAGWLSLTGGGPFTAPPLDPNYTYSQIVILLSDGLNTQDRWPSYGNGSTQYNGAIDARQKILCDNMKSAGVTIYTLQVNTDQEATSSVLQYCASTSDKFFLLTSADQIPTAFQKIYTNITKLRVAK